MVNPLSQLELPDGPNYEEDANAKTVYTHSVFNDWYFAGL